MLSACSGTPKAVNPLPQGSLQAQQTISKAQWRCDGDTDRRWHCHDTSKPDGKVLSSGPLTPLPTELVSENSVAVEERIIESNPGPAESKPNRLDAIDSQTMAITAAGLDDIPDHHYAVQLIAARHMQAIDNYHQNHPQQHTIQLHSVINSEHWYILLLGVYPSYEAANSAIKSISPQPSTRPWIRPVGPLKQSTTLIQ